MSEKNFFDKNAKKVQAELANEQEKINKAKIKEEEAKEQKRKEG